MHIMPPDSLAEMDAVDALAALASRAVGCEEYARALLDRAHSARHLNAFRTLDDAFVLEAARAADKARASGKPPGRLQGLPIPVKDSVNTKQLPTSNGTRALEHFRPREDAAVLRPLLAEGAFVMGKTNLHEMSRSWTCNNGAFGPVLNAYDPGRIPGGSSGGSAVAVAARMAPLAIAEDTLGSIRVPSTLSGVVGFRPTYGRYSGEGIMPLTFDRFDQAGPMARSVRDIVLFDDVLVADQPPLVERSLRGARIGVCSFLNGALHADVQRVVEESLANLEAAGALLIRADIPREARRSMDVARAIIGYENPRSIAAFLQEQGLRITFDELVAQASPNIRELYRLEFTLEGRDAALRDREAISAALDRYFDEHRLDALVFPPVLAPALPLGDNAEVEMPGGRVPLRTVMARATALSSVARLPSLTLPAALTPSGLPVGIEVVSTSGRDREVLALGLAIERVLGRIPAPRVAGIPA
jgi:indoleacetamide hydrolase